MKTHFLDVTDLANSGKVTTQSVRLWKHAGKLPPAHQLTGGQYFWEEHDLREWLKTSPQHTPQAHVIRAALAALGGV